MGKMGVSNLKWIPKGFIFLIQILVMALMGSPVGNNNNNTAILVLKNNRLHHAALKC